MPISAQPTPKPRAAFVALCALLGAASFAAAQAAPPTGAVLPDQQLRFGKDLTVVSELPVVRRGEVVGVETETVIWRWRGQAKFAPRTALDGETPWLRGLAAAPNDALPDDETAPELPVGAEDGDPLETETWIAVPLPTGFEYGVPLPRSLLAMVREGAAAARWDEGDERAGVLPPKVTAGPSPASDGGTPGFGLKAPDAVVFGCSDNDDTRTRRLDNTTFPYRAMGRLNGAPTSGCSGTLIGPRHVLTAAHCLGTCNGAACQPYGQSTAIWYFTPAEFRQETTNFWDIHQHDYGIMVLNDRLGDTTGWLGYAAVTASITRDYCDKVPFGPGYLGGRCFNRGYPARGFAENATLSNNNCQQCWAYEDQNPCEIGAFSEKDGDGWNRVVTVNCDIGRGHSGSALWTDVHNGNGRMVLGVCSSQTSTTCTDDDDDYPNGFRRVMPEVLLWISYFKRVRYP